MSKPLRSKEIIRYLKSGKYSARVISDTLGVSQESIRKVKDAINDLSPERIDELLDMEDFEINRELGFCEDRVIPDSLFAEILEELKKPETTCQSLYDSYNKDKGGEKGGGFPFCSYSVFNAQIKKNCERKNMSNRIKFKPGVFMEIGRIRRKTKNDFFYFYFPFSRALMVQAFSSDCPEQISICNALLSFLVHKVGGVPSRIVCMERLNILISDGQHEVFDNMLFFLGVLFSKQENCCVFNRRKTNKKTSEDDGYDGYEEYVMGRIQKVTGNKSNDALEEICYEHNEEIKNVINEEKQYLGSLPSGEYEFFDSKHRIDRVNCHIKMRHRWYSCNYRYTGKDIFAFISFCKDEIHVNFRASRSKNDHVISSHVLNTKEKSSYVTNRDDLPPSDYEAHGYGLQTFSDVENLVNDSFGQKYHDDCPTIIEVFKRYAGEKEFPVHAYKYINKLCHDYENRDRIVRACKNIRAEDKRVGPELFKELNADRQSSDFQNRKRTHEFPRQSQLPEAVDEDNSEDIPF